MSKKYNLDEHFQDIRKWWYEKHHTSMPEDKERMWAWAYERWTNDKILLSEEDNS